MLNAFCDCRPQDSPPSVPVDTPATPSRAPYDPSAPLRERRAGRPPALAQAAPEWQIALVNVD